MKLIRLLIIGAVYVGIYHLGGLNLIHDAMNLIGPEVSKLIEANLIESEVTNSIGNVNPNAGQAFSLITQNGENWENISRTISNVLNPAAK